MQELTCIFIFFHSFSIGTSGTILHFFLLFNISSYSSFQSSFLPFLNHLSEVYLIVFFIFSASFPSLNNHLLPSHNFLKVIFIHSIPFLLPFYSHTDPFLFFIIISRNICFYFQYRCIYFFLTSQPHLFAPNSPAPFPTPSLPPLFLPLPSLVLYSPSPPSPLFFLLVSSSLGALRAPNFPC